MFYLFLIIAETTNMTSRGNPYRTNFNTRTGGAVSRAIQSSAKSSDDLNPQNSWRSTVSSTAVSTTGTTEGVDLHRIGGAVSRQVQSITGNIQGNIINNNNPYVSHDDIVTNATLSGSSPPTNTTPKARNTVLVIKAVYRELRCLAPTVHPIKRTITRIKRKGTSGSGGGSTNQLHQLRKLLSLLNKYYHA
jgi:hypothetical protein